MGPNPTPEPPGIVTVSVVQTSLASTQAGFRVGKKLKDPWECHSAPFKGDLPGLGPLTSIPSPAKIGTGDVVQRFEFSRAKRVYLRDCPTVSLFKEDVTASRSARRRHRRYIRR